MWHPNAQFPNELKCANSKQRIAYLKNGFYLKQDAVNEAHIKLENKFFDAEERQIALVQGPTGVGKSCLSRKLMMDAYKHLPHGTNFVSKLPMLLINATTPEYSTYSWKDFYASILRAAGELENVRIYGKPIVDGVDAGRQFSTRNRSTSELRQDAIDRIRDYNILYIIIDEVQHIFKYGGLTGDRNLDILKGLATVTGCRFIGLGTYEISFSLETNGQTTRRSELIEFPAYSLKRENDITKFSSAFAGLLAHMPIEMEADVINAVKSMFLGSCGCVGTLKEWLDRALRLSLKQDKQLLSIETLEKTRMKSSQIKAIAEEIREGEAYFTEPDDQELWNILGDVQPAIKLVPTKRSANKTPGRRSPARDEVPQT